MQQTLERSFNVQQVAYMEARENAPTQNKRILQLLKAHEYVPITWIKQISSQYNRSISDLKKVGHVIQSLKHDGIWCKRYIGFDPRK